MAKRAARKAPRVKGPSIYTPPPVDLGKTVKVGAKPLGSEEVVFRLEDGTKLHVRVVLTSVERSKLKFNPNGDPIYQIHAGMLLRTDVPKSLKRKIP